MLMWVVDGYLCDGGPHGPYVRAASTAAAAAAAQSAGELPDGACALCRLNDAPCPPLTSHLLATAPQ